MLLVLASNNDVMADVYPNNLRARTLRVLTERHGKAMELTDIDKLINEYNTRAAQVDQTKGGLLGVEDAYDNVFFGLLCQISTQKTVQDDSNKCGHIAPQSEEFQQAVREIRGILGEANGGAASAPVSIVPPQGISGSSGDSGSMSAVVVESAGLMAQKPVVPSSGG
jgi:hypothetical protein